MSVVKISGYGRMFTPIVGDVPNLHFNKQVLDLNPSLNLINELVFNSPKFENDSESSVDEVISDVCEKYDEIQEDPVISETTSNMRKLSSGIGESIVKTINILKNEVRPTVTKLMDEIDESVADQLNEPEGDLVPHAEGLQKRASKFRIIDWENIYDRFGGIREVTNNWNYLFSGSGSKTILEVESNYDVRNLSFKNIRINSDTKTALINQLNNRGLTMEEASKVLEEVTDRDSLNMLLKAGCLNAMDNNNSRVVNSIISMLEGFYVRYAKYRKVNLDLSDNILAEFYAQNEVIDKAIAASVYMLHCIELHYSDTNAVVIDNFNLNGPNYRKYLSKGNTLEDLTKHVYMKFESPEIGITANGISEESLIESKETVSESFDELAEKVADKILETEEELRMKATRTVLEKYIIDNYNESTNYNSLSLHDFKSQKMRDVNADLLRIGVFKDANIQNTIYNTVFDMNYRNTKVKLAHTYFNEETISTISDNDTIEDDIVEEDVASITAAVSARLAVDFLHESGILTSK